MGCERVCGDHDGADREREHEVDVDHKQRADQGAGEHGCHGYQATGGMTSRSAGEPGVGRDSRQCQSQDCGGEVGHCEPAGRRVLDSHRDRQRHDQRIARILGHRLAENCREEHSEQYWRERGCHRRPQVTASVRARSDGDATAGKCSEKKRAQRRQ